jgi:hypothetical protein
VYLPDGRVDTTLERGFELAYFLHGEEPIAFQVLSHAVAKLQVAAASQDKRLYYKPNGRTKVWLGDADLLQRLIYIESDKYERDRECSGAAGMEQMIIHFVKHLVRITIKRNSFYVILGISRLLHDYTTAETLAIQDLIGDGQRERDDSYYRSRKARLFNEMKERFGDLLRVNHRARGEERFESMLSPKPYVDVVRRSLEHFTPWSTTCSASAGVSAMDEEIEAQRGRSDEKKDEAELARIHSVVHPPCFESAARSLSLDDPDSRLEIPAFNIAGDSGRGDRSDSGIPPTLGEERVAEIRQLLADQGRRRKTANDRRLRVLVDGVERARLDATADSTVRFAVSDEDELIEVIAEDDEARLLLAVLVLTHAEAATKAQRSTIVVEGQQEILFVVSPGVDGTSAVDVVYREHSLSRRIAIMLQRSALMPIKGLGWMSAAAAAAIVTWFAMDHRSSIPTDVPRRVAVLQPQAARPDRLPPVAAIQKGTGESPRDDATRDASSPVMPRAHRDVRTICVIVRNEGLPADSITEAVSSRLKANGWHIVDCDNANAALKIGIDARRPGETLAVSARLVDAAGTVLWPDHKTAAQYEGNAESIAAAIAGDLAK